MIHTCTSELGNRHRMLIQSILPWGIYFIEIWFKFKSFHSRKSIWKCRWRNGGNIFRPPLSSCHFVNLRVGHASGTPGTFSQPRHVRGARAVPRCMSGSLTSGILSVAGKTFSTFSTHAQPAILSIWWEAHVLKFEFKYYILISNRMKWIARVFEEAWVCSEVDIFFPFVNII